MSERLAGDEVEGLPGRLRPVWEECRAALAGLCACTGDPAEQVHVLRRRGKRLRGGLALLGAPRPVRAELRDLGRILGPARDAAVRAETMRRLREQAADHLVADALHGVAVALLAEEAALGEGTPPAPVLEFVGERLAAVDAWLGQDPPVAAGWERRLWRMQVQVERRLARLAKGKGGRGARLHAARKAVKRLHGALWFLFPDAEGITGKTLKRLLDLGDELGEIQDLEVLRSWLVRCGLTRQRLPGLHRAIRAERRRLLDHVRERAAGWVRRVAEHPLTGAEAPLTCPATDCATPTGS